MLLSLLYRHQVVAVVECAPASYRPNRWRQAAKEWQDLQRVVQGRTSLLWLARLQRLPYLYWHPGDDEACLALIAQQQPDALCVAAANRTLPPAMLEHSRLGNLSVHPSLLPDYRGAEPLLWQYYYGDLRGGVTVHVLDEGENTGDIVQQAELEIPLGAPLSSLMRSYDQLASSLMLQALNDLSSRQARLIAQAHLPCPNPAPRVQPGDMQIDWQDAENWPLARVWHVLRGIHNEREDLKLLPYAGHGVSWRIGQTQPGSRANILPGRIGFDGRGQFVQHLEGKIRLSTEFSLRRWLFDVI